MTREYLSLLPDHIRTLKEERGIIIKLNSKDDLFSAIEVANTTKTTITPDLGQTDINSNRVLLDFSGLNRVINYRSEELLLNIESGISVESIAKILKPNRQRLATCYNGSRTLLSILGEEALSLSSTRYGPLRQWVVGIEAITGDGKSVHYGGEVVKNVTGYDLNRLFIGNHHKYGLINRVILKLEPEPESTCSFLFHLDEFQDAAQLIEELLQTLSTVEILTLFRTKTTFGWQVLLTLSGYREIVQREMRDVYKMTSHLKADLQEYEISPKLLEQWIRRLDWTYPQEPAALVLRIVLPQREFMVFSSHMLTQPWLTSVDRVFPQRTDQLILRWGSMLPEPSQLYNLRAEVTELGGFTEILRISPLFNLDSERFNADPQPVIRNWETGLKHKFDPNYILAGGMLTPPNSPKEDSLQEAER